MIAFTERHREVFGAGQLWRHRFKPDGEGRSAVFYRSPRLSVVECFGTGGLNLVWRAPALLVEVMLLGADGSSAGDVPADVEIGMKGGVASPEP